MSERIETLIREYPKKKRDLECLKRQIADFKGITDEELLDEATFTGFDFTNVWEMGANGPRLKNLS